MFSMEFYNKCNITQPDMAPLSLGPINKCTFSATQVNFADILSSSKSYQHNVMFANYASKKLKRESKCWSSINGSATGKSKDSTAEMDNENSDDESSDGSSSLFFGKPTDKEELAAIRESAMRTKLMRKLSDANLYGRHLQRQLLDKEAALVSCKSELALMETEVQALARLAQEIANEGPKPGSRKINGKYIHSHLAVRLEELHERLTSQVKDIDAVCYRDVNLVWYGMAEDVQVMGSFDGWTQGQPMSPENTGAFTKFTTTISLRPGRYEIKFLADGEWQVSPDLPLVGEGLTVNNLLVVE